VGRDVGSVHPSEPQALTRLVAGLARELGRVRQALLVAAAHIAHANPVLIGALDPNGGVVLGPPGHDGRHHKASDHESQEHPLASHAPNRDTLRAVIADGTYDVFIVDATELDSGGWQLELTILAGDHKGELVTINAQGLEGSEFDLLGMPGTLVVTDGVPGFRVDS
jgi:hypothetical protein